MGDKLITESKKVWFSLYSARVSVDSV